MRGIAHLFLLQHQLDSALCYFQKAYYCALATQDLSMFPLLYNDFLTVYLVIYDSIQKLSDRQKLDALMDSHHLEEHKRMVPQQEQTVRKAFIDVMANLEKCCSVLTNDDHFLLPFPTIRA